MKIKDLEKVHLDDYGINVNQYLTYDEIQKIANEAIKLNSWAERQEVIDYLIMCYATDMQRDEIDKLGHSALLKSGIIDEVKCEVRNYYSIHEAIKYETSIVKQLASILDKLPDIAKEAVEKAKK